MMEMFSQLLSRPALIAAASLFPAWATAADTSAVDPPRTAPESVTAQREALKQLMWLVGEWEGEGLFQLHDGTRVPVLSWEGVEAAADGLALVIRGRHDLLQPEGARGKRMHDAVALVTYEPAKGSFRVVTQTQRGHGGVFSGTYANGRFNWSIPQPNGETRYEIKSTPTGDWAEEGLECTPKGCTSFFQMVLKRKR